MDKITDIPIPDDAEVEIIIVNGQKYVRIIEPSRMTRRSRSPVRRSPERRFQAPVIRPPSPERRPRSPERRHPSPERRPRSPERRPRSPVRRSPSSGSSRSSSSESSRSRSPERYPLPRPDTERVSRSPVRIRGAMLTPRGSPTRLSQGRQYNVQRTLGIRSTGPLNEIADQINEQFGSNVQINWDGHSGIIEINDSEAALNLNHSVIVYTTPTGKRIQVTYYLLT